MITVHHLNNSRSQRILWLLEELRIPYEVVKYQRDPQTRLAPPELKGPHPLGKAPVIEDDGRIVAESGAVIEYVLRKYGNGRLAPDPALPAYIDYLQWMHFAEGSAMLPLLLALYVGRLGEAGAPLKPRITSEIANHLGYMDKALEGKDYFLGDELSAADIHLSFVVEAADARGFLKDYPNLIAFRDRYRARPAWQRAIEKGGPFTLGK
ncbi:MAG TPA: glutathione S-transferase [Magnetospirillaceae bacterium]|jgi:glutathione S-transferase